MPKCRKCDTELVEGENWYVSYAKRNDCICKACKRSSSRQWRKEHPQKVDEYNRRWRADHPDYHSQYQRQWHKQHPAYASQYYADHREERAEYNSQYYGKYSQEICDDRREYRAEHPEECRERYRQWYYKNLERARALSLKHSHRYRARKSNVAIEEINERAIHEYYNHTCIYCGGTEANGKEMTLDHVVALRAGGLHCEDNLVLACRGCNASKGANLLEEWLQTQPRALAWAL